MLMRLTRRSFVWSLSLTLLGTAALGAQAPAQTATQFYTAYRTAFDKAKSIDELLPYMASDIRKQVEQTPASNRPDMFKMMKMMGVMNNVKVLKEERTPTGATLTVEGVDGSKHKSSGKIDIVRENGAWKLGKENWSSGS